MDQPRINAYVSLTSTGSPLVVPGDEWLGTADTYNIEAYFDTGASGVLLSTNTATALGILQATTTNGTPIVYSDVGVGGTQDFNVSDGIYISLGVYANYLDAAIDPNATLDELIAMLTYEPAISSYNQHYGPIRMQLGMPATNAVTDPTEDAAWGDLDQLIQQLLGSSMDSLDVFGMPLMQGKVIVMDCRPVNDMVSGGMSSDLALLGGTMKTYIYNPGTSYNAATNTTNPGIPGTNRHVKLSYVSFDDYTAVEPAGAVGPSMSANPFIGANPLNPADNTPDIVSSFGTKSFSGSFLLDTGAAASMISEGNALSLGVRYRAGTKGTSTPVLEDLNGNTIPNQYTLTISGIGGSTTAAGFYMDTMTIPTTEGDPIVIHGAPVLVSDITVMNPTTHQTMTLDGIFGMNNLVGSAEISQSSTSLFPDIGDMAASAFDWAVFDQPNGILGLSIADLPGNPPTATLVSAPAVTAAGGTTYSFQVKYEGTNPVSVASLDTSDILVTTPTGAVLTATPQTSGLTNAASLTVTYKITPPGGTWDFSDNGTYTLTCKANQVSDTGGLSAAQKAMGTFKATIADTTPPTTSLSTGTPTAGKTTWKFTVTYTDNKGVKTSTIGANDILVTGPNGYSQVAKYLSKTYINSTSAAGTYQIPAPGGKWDSKDNGTYTIKIQNKQICDVSGNYIVAGTVGTAAFSTAKAMTVSKAVFSTTAILPTKKVTDVLAEVLGISNA